MKGLLLSSAFTVALLSFSQVANAGHGHADFHHHHHYRGTVGRTTYYAPQRYYAPQVYAQPVVPLYRAPVYHDTTHFDYHPPTVIRHRNHFHVAPGHYDLHRSGHFDY